MWYTLMVFYIDTVSPIPLRILKLHSCWSCHPQRCLVRGLVLCGGHLHKNGLWIIMCHIVSGASQWVCSKAMMRCVFKWVILWFQYLEHKALNGRMNDESEIWKEEWLWPNWGNILEYAWMDGENYKKTSVWIASFLAEIQSERLQNTSHKCYY
jgi:hypothetical protein